MRFRPSTGIEYVCILVWCTLLGVFNRCVFDENAQRISVDGRTKRIEMYVFSNENALTWIGLRRQNNNFARASYLFFAVFADYHVKMLICKFLFLNLDRDPRNSTPGGFAYFC